MDFDRKEYFRSSCKEDRKSNEAPKMRWKQGEAAHGRAAAARATHGRAVPPAARGLLFSATYLFSLCFLGDCQAFFLFMVISHSC